MEIQSELCLIEGDRTIVSVSAWEGNKKLGSSLGEGPTVEIAEDKGLKRLIDRLGVANESVQVELRTSPKDDFNPTSYKNKSINIDPKISEEKEPSINKEEPQEWSKELSEIEVEIRRLGWDRDRENNYLTTNFGIVERSRITSYGDLLNYIEKLKNIDSQDSQEEEVQGNEKVKLLADSDSIIRKLNWSTTMARDFLIKRMNATSRQQLDAKRLKEFNKLLTTELSSD